MPSSGGWDLSPDFCDSETRLIRHCFPVSESLPKGHRFHFIYLIEVKLIYHVVLVSGVQESDSVIHIYIYIFFFRYFSIIGYYKILNTLIVPCAMQQVLVVYHSIYNSLHLLVSNSQFIPPLLPSPLVTTSLFSVHRSPLQHSTLTDTLFLRGFFCLLSSHTNVYRAKECDIWNER